MIWILIALSLLLFTLNLLILYLYTSFLLIFVLLISYYIETSSIEHGHRHATWPVRQHHSFV